MNKIKQFESYIESECKKLKIDLIKVNYGQLKINNIPLNGYFDRQGKELAYSVKKNDNNWIELLAHEFSHLLQFKENKELYLSFESSIEKFDEWLNDKIQLNDKQLNKVILMHQKMEQDANIRAFNLLKEFNIDFDEELYIKKSNAYVLFYDEVKKTRMWYNHGSEPYNNSQILQKMPKEFLKF